MADAKIEINGDGASMNIIAPTPNMPIPIQEVLNLPNL
jgi:hypothetical protein